jgi:cytochrome P450
MLLNAQDEESGAQMSDEQIRDECMTIFSPVTKRPQRFDVDFLSFVAKPEAEAKFHRELDEVLKDKPLTPEDYPASEIYRKRLSRIDAAFSARLDDGRLAIEDHEFGGFAVPKGLARSGFDFCDAPRRAFLGKCGRISPERWETVSVKEAGQKFVYFPFSKGVRSCIGEQFAWTEGVLLLAALGRRWKLSLMPEQKSALQAMITLRPNLE